MELDDKSKEVVRELGAAINSAVEKSPQVAEAIEKLRECGYEMQLTLRLEIGLRPVETTDIEIYDDKKGEVELELTDEDLRTLRRMKIRIDT